MFTKNNADQKVNNALQKINENYCVNGFYEQKDDGDYKPVRGFVRSSFCPLIYHSVHKVVENLDFNNVAPESKGIILSSMFTNPLVEEALIGDELSGKSYSPILFPQSVVSSIIGLLTKELAIYGPMSCMGASRHSVYHALQQAVDWIEEKDAESVIIVFCDVSAIRTQLWLRHHLPLGEDNNKNLTSSAISIVLQRKSKTIKSTMTVNEFYQFISNSNLPLAWNIDWLPRSTYFRTLVDACSPQTALHCGQETVSYEKLQKNIIAIRTQIDSKTQVGQRLVIDIPDSFTSLYWCIAAWSMGICVHIVDQRMTEIEKQTRLDLLHPDFLVTLSKDVDNNFNTGCMYTELTVKLSPSINNTLNKENINYTDRNPAYILFSSGSTGKPKMIARDFESLDTEWHSLLQEPGIQDKNSRVLSLVPACHSYGIFAVVMPTLLQGGELIFPEAILPHQIVDEIINSKVTHIYGTPFHFNLIYKELKKRLAELTDVPLFLSAGGKLNSDLQKDYQELGITIGQSYGMSEVGYIAADFLGSQPNSVGKIAAHHNYEIKENGELALQLKHSPYLSSQKNWQAVANQKNSNSGTLLVQDLVNKDKNDYLYIEGRTNDQVSIGGLKVNLSEVEATLMKFPGIDDCCVIAHEHPAIGTYLEAFWVGNQDELSINDLKNWLKNQLALYKNPKRITWVQAIPKSATGKTLPSKLVETIS